jgi:hypothetical protein
MHNRNTLPRFNDDSYIYDTRGRSYDYNSSSKMILGLGGLLFLLFVLYLVFKKPTETEQYPSNHTQEMLQSAIRTLQPFTDEQARVLAMSSGWRQSTNGLVFPANPELGIMHNWKIYKRNGKWQISDPPANNANGIANKFLDPPVTSSECKMGSIYFPSCCCQEYVPGCPFGPGACK